MKIQLPKDVSFILDTYLKNGYQAFIVGGCVRDALLGKTPTDYDICTNALPKETLKLFSDFRIIETGIKHGTVTLLLDSVPYEITTFRTDGDYLDSRHPQSVSFVTNIEEDLKRRDFTVNAMAYNQTDGLIDLYGGQKDLENKIIRCVGNSEQRFTEDALRILRAVRFSAQLGFEIEGDTLQGIEECKALLVHISKERVRDEFLKICLSPRPDHINELRELGVLEYIIPEFIGAYSTPQNHPHHVYNVAQHTIVAMQNIEPTVRLRLTMLLHDIGKISTRTTDKHGIDHFYNHPKKSVQIEEKVLKELKLDNRMIKEVGQLIYYHDYHIKHIINKVYVKKMLKEIGPELFDELLKVQRADALAQNLEKLEPKYEIIEKQRKLKEEIIANREPYQKSMMKITGSDLMEAGIPKGKEIGWLLDRALDKIIHSPEYNEKDKLIAYCQKLYKDKG